MKLTDIDLKGLGQFLPGEASFGVDSFVLPQAWDYIYTNGRVLLRVRHDGRSYAQLDPPGGTVLYRMERFQDYPSFFVWLKPEDGPAFSNFWTPRPVVDHPFRAPERYGCAFAPAQAVFSLTHAGLEVETVVTVPVDEPAVLMRVTITNNGEARRVHVTPVWRPHNTSSALEPWDVPELYQSCQYANSPHQLIWVETRNPGGVARLRRRAFVMTDLAPDDAEVSYERFVGRGSFSAPQAILEGRLGVDAKAAFRYLQASPENTLVAQLPVAAFHKSVRMAKGERLSFTQVLAGLPQVEDGTMPPYAALARYERYLAEGAMERAGSANYRAYKDYQTLRSVSTPDEAFNRYVNEWLPLQLRWVTLLDRGWPTGMRGTRDAAQDYTALIPLYPEESRRALFDMLACQRTDGWFPRQYSTDGPEGRHDLRPYVDSGLWVWELLFDYVRYTGDTKLLHDKVRWLDRAEQSTVLEHAQALLGYYLADENKGEHGLAKLRGGDWLDSVNAAGLEGRGESVMVSCQTVLALRQAVELLGPQGVEVCPYQRGAESLRQNIRRHALNAEGYLNSYFTDAGDWICSPRDPDGQRRIGSPANSFGVVAGVFEPGELPRLFERLERLKQESGYALFSPGIGEVPIPKLGRIGQGDLLPGVGENGTPYNHGSHGFLGRAAATAGRGDLLHDVMLYMLPYDQSRHPVAVSKSAPYAVVNHWASIQGQAGRGGAAFLSGSIGTALRNVYGGMLGFEPGLEGLRISPCLPSSWRRVRYEHRFRGSAFHVVVENPAGVQSGVRHLKVNGRRVETGPIPYRELDLGRSCELEVVLG